MFGFCKAGGRKNDTGGFWWSCGVSFRDRMVKDGGDGSEEFLAVCIGSGRLRVGQENF